MRRVPRSARGARECADVAAVRYEQIQNDQRMNESTIRYIMLRQRALLDIRYAAAF